MKLLTLHDNLYPLLEYPVIKKNNLNLFIHFIKKQKKVFTQQYPSSFESFFPNKQNQIIFQNYFFYFDDLDIKSFNIANGEKSLVLSVKNTFGSEDFKPYKMEFRPLSSY